uniref:Uncharacterized protein n=3 Tax=Oryza TaxID=4527 RepID=A0A0D3FJW8_9ORYZ
MATAMVNHLAELRAPLAMVLSDADAARATLDEAAGLLREEIQATELLLAHAFSAIAPRDGPALAAAAKLAARVFSDAPLLPGAIRAAMGLVASVYALPPPHAGTLEDARLILGKVFDDHHDATWLFRLYANCTPNYGIQPGDETWQAWSARNEEAFHEAAAAETRLISAIWEARHAVRVHRDYQAQSRRREVAWEAKQILSTATEEVDAASVAVRRMRDALAAEEQIVREAIGEAAAPESEMASPSGVATEAEAEAVANHLAELRARLAMILSDAEAARATLDEAAGLLREEIHAIDHVLLARAFSAIAPRDGPDHLAAAAKLAARVFSDAPLLPGAIRAAMDLVASVYALPPQRTGTLQDARLTLGAVVNGHHDATDLFTLYVNSTPNRRIQPGDETWLAWSARNEEAFTEAAAAEVRLMSAIREAKHAVRVHHVYQAQSRRREVAWEAKQILSTATEEVDAASVAIRQMCDALAAEEQIVREAIGEAAALSLAAIFQPVTSQYMLC